MKKLLILALALVAAACGSNGETAEKEAPATLIEVAGTELWKIELTQLAADRLDIQTTEVSATDAGMSVPSDAVIIIPDGTYWVYTNPEPLTYLREELTSVYEEDLHAFFENGPAPGSKVVTVGVPELYGTEFGIGK
ncbi:MAG: hypothetical protein KJO36_06015 [Acidimicrobiia bacterium]|nr:hypothetical protein [Acidimicrobiia bacterium]MBT8250134.1 hypothetical protein [Acidimicrobiia bacterium]NNC43822.1 hypothetical protein [Acidimicrobiia bacterium]NND13074.1 hypothetical protein [Acidimicrobiia bacterium]NNL28297.1 hypothetical protein [Acidimicrobiia bacterium]